MCTLTSDKAPGTAASKTKAADAKSCSFMIVMYVLILRVLVICEHKIMFNYEVKYKVEFASKESCSCSLTQKIFFLWILAYVLFLCKKLRWNESHASKDSSSQARKQRCGHLYSWRVACFGVEVTRLLNCEQRRSLGLMGLELFFNNTSLANKSQPHICTEA